MDQQPVVVDTSARHLLREIQLTVALVAGAFVFGGIVAHALDLFQHKEREVIQDAVVLERLNGLKEDLAELKAKMEKLEAERSTNKK